MAQFWCITCKKEVEHRAHYCHSKCGNECEQICSVCNRKTLTTISDELKGKEIDISEDNAVRWARGKAQRQARETGSKEAEIPIPRLENGVHRYLHLIYYTETDTFINNEII
ncbi:MAG: hypothetical protein GBAus27B_000414 [Mycoplasmataceae bacterium]|nr:MAG: hypothetical protein GBAus27B_000414 [Mycoplasmataceae bacterium]